MIDTIQGEKNLFQKVLTTFVITLLIATIGLYVGQFIPAVLLIPLMVAELVMVICAFWLRKKKSVSYGFVYAFSFISGITTFPILNHYVSTTGAQVVLMAFGTTFGIFAIMGFIGAKTKKDLSFLANFLLVALLALIFVGIFSIFSPLSSMAMLAFSVIGAIVFSLYVIYDFNQMKHQGITEEMVPLLALSLYLDFVNLFISILRIFGILSDED